METKTEISPLSQMDSLIKMTRKAAKCCGADFFDSNYKTNIITVVMGLSVITYFVFAFYTIYIKFHDDWKVLIETLCLAAGAIQGSSKFLVGFFNQKTFLEIRDKIYEVYYYYENVDERFRRILQKSMDRIKFTIIANICAWLATGLTMFLIPVYYKYIKNERILMIQFLMPGIDPNTESGYIILYGIQSICLFFGLFGNLAGDTFFILNVQISVMFYEILQQKVIDFNKMLNTPIKNKEIIDKAFQDLIKWTQECYHFSNLIASIFSIWAAIEIFFCAMGAIFSIYIIITGNWPAAYAYFILNFFILYIYCFLGTALDIAASECIDVIYEIEWYNLDLKSQKIITLMLMKAQQKNLIELSGVVPLSVNTGLQVTKTVYSYIMMLLNFVE